MRESSESLTEAMVDMMARGETLARISAKVGLPVPIVHERIMDALDGMTSAMSVTQMRMLQLHRLQTIMPKLYEMAEAETYGAESLAQSKNIKTLIELIREVTELMDLKKDRLRDEQVRLTQAQTEMLLSSVDLMRVEIFAKVREVLAAGGGIEGVESMWDVQFSESAANAIERNSAAIIQVGQGAGPLELAPLP